MPQAETHLVLIHNPALELLVIPIVAIPLLDDLVDRQVLQARALSQQFAMRRLADAGGARDDEVWLGARHGDVSCGTASFCKTMSGEKYCGSM